MNKQEIIEKIKKAYHGSLFVFPMGNDVYDAGSLHAIESFDPDKGPREWLTHDTYVKGYYDCWALMQERFEDMMEKEVENA
jgi:hypothetical protein